MAKVYNNVLGDMVGKIGPLVGYLWRGQPVFRAYVKHIRYPDTERQQAERNWFVTMVRFAAAARPALLLGLRDSIRGKLLTEGNYFVQRNKQHFRYPTHNDLSVTLGLSSHAQRHVVVDYSRLALSEGPVAPVVPTCADVTTDGILAVDFDRNCRQPRCKDSDSVYLYVYDATEQRGLLSGPVRRSSAHHRLRLPDAWQTHDLHCYLFALDAQGHASATTYVLPTCGREAEYDEPTFVQIDGTVPLVQTDTHRNANEVFLYTGVCGIYPRGRPMVGTDKQHIVL